MAKLTLTDIASLTNESTVITAINANNALIEAAMEDTLTRDDNTSNPNAMSVDLQMGGKKITNLGTPTAATDAVTKAYVDASTGNDIGDITASVAAAEASATAAAASATEAQEIADGYVATSTSSVAIATGEKTFTIQADKNYTAGQYVLIVSDADPATNYMFGSVTSYSGTTLVVEVTVVGGSGTLADWTVNIAGVRGATGASGSGAGDVTAASNFSASGRLIASAGTDKSVDDTTVAVSGSAVSAVSTLAMTGTLTNTNAGAVLTGSGAAAAINLGAPLSANSPVVNFKSSGSTTDYDSRIIASGGSSSNGAGTLTLTAATVAVTGVITEGGNPVLSTAGADNLTGGFSTTEYNIGTLNGASDPYEINPLNGYIQYYSNAGAHELTEPTATCVVIVQMTNITGAGTPTLSFDKLTGDTITSTVGRVYELTIRKLPTYSVCNVLRIDV